MISHFLFSTVAVVTGCVASSAAAEPLPSSSSYRNGGCFAQRYPDWPKLRVCNSEDPSDAKGYCQPADPDLNYLEIRIYSQNWEGAYVNAWILQILLSELLGVPTTLEPGVPDLNLSFYDAENGFGFGVSTDVEALKRSNTEPDCRKVKAAARAVGEYQSCAHVIPEVWQQRRGQVMEYAERGEVEPGQSYLGTLAVQGWYIPRFAGAADPTLTSYFGLAGEENRRKLAETFLSPTTWRDYCEEVSLDNCANADPVARRRPIGDEGSKYFVDGQYIGHFRATEENDCDKNPRCTGHIADYYCGWGGFAQQQTYHLGIALRSKEEPGDLSTYGYSPSQISELWAAANATRSPLITAWYTPTILIQEFIGTDAEFQRVTLPPPTQVCVENRLSAEEKCSSVVKERVGSPLGACDYKSEALTKAYASGLYSTINNPDISEGSRSPAYEALQNYLISEHQINQVFGYLAQRRNQSEIGFALRDATCEWAVDNLEFLQSFIPRTYPRATERVGSSVLTEPLFVISLLLACGALSAVILTGVFVWRRRELKIIKYAQVEFIILLIFGLSFVSIGAITSTAPPSDAVCVTIVWLINFGYTLELAPLIVKIAALNRLNASEEPRRIEVPRKNLFGILLVLCGVAISYCILWTALDAPRTMNVQIVTNQTTDLGETIVRLDNYCDSKSSAWEFIGISWYTFLLVCASAVAFQTRQLRQDFNETKTLTLMIYSHFIFTVMRLVSHLIATSENQSVVQRYRSLLLSSDVIATVVIYFVPKLVFQEDQQTLSRGALGPVSNQFNVPESTVPAMTIVENRRSHRVSEEEVS